MQRNLEDPTDFANSVADFGRFPIVYRLEKQTLTKLDPLTNQSKSSQIPLAIQSQSLQNPLNMYSTSFQNIKKIINQHPIEFL